MQTFAGILLADPFLCIAEMNQQINKLHRLRDGNHADSLPAGSGLSSTPRIQRYQHRFLLSVCRLCGSTANEVSLESHVGRRMAGDVL